MGDIYAANEGEPTTQSQLWMTYSQSDRDLAVALYNRCQLYIKYSSISSALTHQKFRNGHPLLPAA